MIYIILTLLGITCLINAIATYWEVKTWRDVERGIFSLITDLYKKIEKK